MARIRVTPENLDCVAVSLRDKSRRLFDMVAEINRAYFNIDWEIREKIQRSADVKNAEARARRLSEDLLRMAEFLSTKAQAYDAADRQSADGLNNLDNSIKQMQAGISAWLASGLEWWKKLWPFFPLAILPISILPLLPNIPWPPSVKPQPVLTPTPKQPDVPSNGTISPERRSSFSGLAENVRAGIGDRGGYPRNGYAVNGIEPISNCTWYAAEAVKKASGGTIDINKDGPYWGNAGNWLSGAKDYAIANPDGPVLGADKSPRPGDIYTTNGHVAFVEEVTLTPDGKKMEVILTEENAIGGGAVGKNSTQVSVIGDDQGVVKRWRRIKTYDIEPGSNPPRITATGVEFIHFRYTDSK